MKKIFSILTLSCLAVQISASAHYNDYHPSYDSNCCCSNQGANWSDGFSLRADYLYWTAQEDQLQYAVKIPLEDIINEIQTNQTVVGNFPIKEHKFNWNSGFRVGLGYNAPCTNWDFALVWTYFRDNSHSHVSDPDGGLFPSAAPGFGIAEIIIEISGGEDFRLADRADSSLKFRLNEIDFEWGATCCQCWNINFRPYIGLKGACIKQTHDISYEGLDNPITVTNKNDFWGIGPRLGVDACWNIGYDFNLVGSTSFSLLYGRFKTSNDSSLSIPMDEGTPLFIAPKFTDSQHKVQPALEMMLGFNWQSCVYEMPLKIGVGYQFQYWWNQWRAPASMVHPLLNESTSHGDLTLQGLTVSATLAF